MASDNTKSLRDRLALQILLLTSVIIVIVTVVAVLIAGAHVKKRVLLQLSSEVSAKEDLIEQRLQQDWEHMSLWARQLNNRVQIDVQDIFRAAQEEGIPLLGAGLFASDGSQIASVGALQLPTLPQQVGGGTPVVTDEGWIGHVVVVPMKANDGAVQGYLVGKFDMRDALAGILNVSEIGESAELLLGKDSDGELFLLHHRYEQADQTKSIGSLRMRIHQNDPLARAVLRQEGVIRTDNYEGRDVFASYRYLPRLGWGMALTLDANEALIGMWAIAIAIGAVGLLLLGMAMLLSVSFATRLTAPLQDMAQKVRQLGPKHWQYESTVDTGDELQLVDATVADMARRLGTLYTNLEQKVRDRTEELREQYEIDRAILRSALHGIVLVSPEGHVVSMNPAAEQYLCRDASICEGLPIQQVLPLFRQGNLVEAEQNPILQCLHAGKPIAQKPDVHWKLQNAHGDMLAVNLSVTPVFNGEKMVGAIAEFRDVTEERRVDEVKSEFISLASHQLRTPLSVIKWYTELLDEGASLKDEQLRNQYLTEIQRAGDRMSNLVDALLQAAQLESRGIMAEKVEVDMREFVAGLEKELETLAQDKHIDCQIILPEEPIILQTDPVLLHIVIQNLFSNAVKYTDDGGEVHIILEKHPDKAVLRVQDTGIGIPSGDRKNIFQRLFRAENAKQSVTNGSGLGLYISRMILEILGGTISFTSEEDRGTTFTVELFVNNDNEQEQ